jgi:hypothetical protein
MMQAPTGVEGAGVVTATLQLESKAYPDWVKVEQFYSALLDGVRRHLRQRHVCGGGWHEYTDVQ